MASTKQVKYRGRPDGARPALLNQIVLVGFMGSGKSTIGPLVARHLGVSFVDLDAEIVRKAGMPIAAIFKAGGEAGFRRLESAVLAAALRAKPGVVAAGGGVVKSVANRKRLKMGRGVLVVWLDVAWPALWARLRREDHSPSSAAR